MEDEKLIGILDKEIPNKEFKKLVQLYNIILEIEVDNSFHRINVLREYFKLLVKHYYYLYMTEPKGEGNQWSFKIGSLIDFDINFNKDGKLNVKINQSKGLGRIGIEDLIKRFFGIYGYPSNVKKIKIIDIKEIENTEITKLKDEPETDLRWKLEEYLREYITSEWKSGKIFRNFTIKESSINTDFNEKDESSINTDFNEKAYQLLKEEKILDFNRMRNKNSSLILDLSTKDLSNANLSNANLSNADLSNADLSNADLSNADLSNADLSNANLSNADLPSANLFNANLFNANLYGANLIKADLIKANLSKAKLSNADLINADLPSANLFNANLFNANLSNANLSKAKLSNADLSGANLSAADLVDSIIIHPVNYYNLKINDKTNFTFTIIDDPKFFDYIKDFTKKIPNKIIRNKKELKTKLEEISIDQQYIQDLLASSKLPEQ